MLSQINPVISSIFAPITCVITCLVFFCTPVGAQQFKFCGIGFNPEHLEQVDSENYLVNFNQEESLVRAENVGRWLLNKALQNEVLLGQISSASIAEYFESCPAQLETAEEQKLLMNLLSRKDLDGLSWKKFFSRNPENIITLKAALKTEEWQEIVSSGRSSMQHSLIASAIFNLFLFDDNWVVSEIPKLFHFFQPEIFKQAKLLLIESVESKEVLQITKLAASFSRHSDFMALSEAGRLALSLLNFQHEIVARKIDPACGKLTEIKFSDPLMAEIVYPLYREILLVIFGYSLDRALIGQSSDFSDCIVRIDAKRTSPAVFSSVSRFLDQIGALGGLSQLSAKARKVLSDVVPMEASLQLKYSELLEVELKKSLVAGNFEGSYVIYEELDPANRSKFSASLAKLARKRGKNNLADRLSPETSSSTWIFISVLVFCGSLLIYLFRKKRGWLKTFLEVFEKPSQSKSYNDYGEHTEDEPSRQKSFVRVENARPHSQELSDYYDTLKKFSLPTSASLKDIKSAYRQLVKNCHPDLNPNQTEVQKKEFINLTNIYDRLLEQRKAIGMDQD